MHTCKQCGREMNPVEWIMGSVCGQCCRLNQAEVTGVKYKGKRPRR